MPGSRAQLGVSRGNGRLRTRSEEDASVAPLWRSSKLRFFGLSQVKARNTKYDKWNKFVQKLVKYLMILMLSEVWYRRNHLVNVKFLQLLQDIPMNPV